MPFFLFLLFLLPLSALAQDLSPRGDVRLVVISDLNSSYGSLDYEAEVDSTVARIPRIWKPDAVLISGDMIAGQKADLPDENVRAMWGAFDARVAAPLREAGIPVGFSLGNHDGSGHPGHERDRREAEAFWADPEREATLSFIDRAQFPFYYTFDVGGVFVLAWDATTSVVPHLDWVEAALASPEAQEAPVRIVIGHLPLYAVAEGRNRRGEVLENPEALRALLERHRVNAYISGHHHAYYPGRRGSLELLHTGVLGQGARPLLGTDEPMPPTVTVMDIDVEQGRLRYTTFDAATLAAIDERGLPPVLHGINGFVLRRDVIPSGNYRATLSEVGGTSTSVRGSAYGSYEGDRLHLRGRFEVFDFTGRVSVVAGPREGETAVQPLAWRRDGMDEGHFDEVFSLDADWRDALAAGLIRVMVELDGTDGERWAVLEGTLRPE
jgi:hypothetical protein